MKGIFTNTISEKKKKGYSTILSGLTVHLVIKHIYSSCYSYCVCLAAHNLFVINTIQTSIRNIVFLKVIIYQVFVPFWSKVIL